MEPGICLQSLIPVRAEPSHKSELVTQVLFGELYHVAEKENAWYKIKLLLDGYEGWIDKKQADLLDEAEFLRLSGSKTSVTIDLVQLLSNESTPTMIPVLLGSSLPAFSESRIRIGEEVYVYEGLVSRSMLDGTMIRPNNAEIAQQLIADAMLYINTPYMWGGRSPFGIDCSGLIQMVHKLQGVYLQRDAAQQATQGEAISLLAEAKPGDLAFFDDNDGNITHVGMLIDQHRIIHCSGKVKIDTLDHHGIYDTKLQNYTHKLRLIRRIF
jgi:gamma-D-glutamyl-L-lysine dipeptidyl-peptidase